MELELLKKVRTVQFEQSEYWRMKKIYGNATQQLNKCKRLETDLKRYVDKRMKELESKQTDLFAHGGAERAATV